MKKLFTERHGEGKARVAEFIDDATREGLLTLVSARIDEEWFGLSFNEKCGDGYPYAGTDLTRLGRTMKGYGIIWPHDVDRSNPPSWRSQNGFCRARPICGCRRRSTSVSGSNNCSFRMESRSTEVALLEPA